jgi:hypothetical protein
MNKNYICFVFIYALAIFIFSTTLDARRLTPEEAAAPYPVTAPFTTTERLLHNFLFPKISYFS